MAFGLPLLLGKAATAIGGLKGAGDALGLIGAAKSAFGRPAGGGPGRQSYAQLMGAFRAADEAGIHRLAVAGSPAGYSPAPVSSAEGFLAAGDILRNRGNRRKENELLDAQIEEARSRTILNEANARRAMMGPQPGLGGARTALGVAFDQLANGGERAIRREPEPDMPATQTVTLGRNTARGPNPESFEVGLSELAAGLLIYGPQWLGEEIRRRGIADRSSAGAEPKSRDAARRRASESNRRANQSPYLGVRRR